MNQYFSGQALYGNDLSEKEIKAWYRDEEEAYASLSEGTRSGPCIPYLNALLFRHLPRGRYPRVLGLGSAEGKEFYPLRERVEHITVIEPSEGFRQTSIFGVRCEYLKPAVDGSIMARSAFDLATAFAVLHHIPNVTFVIGQLFQALKPGGWLLLHEPIESMGDWRQPRAGLTTHERGIPAALLRKSVLDAGFSIRTSQYFSFPLTERLLSRAIHWRLGVQTAVSLDLTVSSLCSPLARYHPTKPWHKLRPRCIALVAQKPR